ncbi:hypothetical protein F511_40078 [Dorcoceras hygrometricum]|uniref:Uncharacterized protein n=1 Tax=Dorcoceras hygrometricum TaxID=472368 RepID=A0A2Z7BPR2_9LAMI|nr:hypothetical protein F511_40078 [Dorcoceras hygrometricum]
MGPISNIGPKSSRAARDRPELNPISKVQPSQKYAGTTSEGGRTVAAATKIAVFSQLPCWRLGAWLRPVSRGNRHFTVGGGRLRESGPRPEGRLLRQPALEGLTRSARTDSPRKVGRSNSGEGRRRWRVAGTAAAAASRGGRRPRDFGARVRVVLCCNQVFD